MGVYQLPAVVHMMDNFGRVPDGEGLGSFLFCELHVESEDRGFTEDVDPGIHDLVARPVPALDQLVAALPEAPLSARQIEAEVWFAGIEGVAQCGREVVRLCAESLRPTAAGIFAGRVAPAPGGPQNGTPTASHRNRMKGVARLQFAVKSAMKWSEVMSFWVTRVEAMKSLRFRSSM